MGVINYLHPQYRANNTRLFILLVAIGSARYRPLMFLSGLCLQALDLKAMGSRHWKIVGCSAVTGAGLLTGFDWVVSDICARIFLLD